MKASRFNVIVPQQDSGGALVQNTLYGSRTLLRKDEVDGVRALLRDPGSTDGDPAELRDGLVRQKHLIEDDVDEMSIVRERKRAGMQDTNRLDVILMPTLDCNFACTYCYERHEPSLMSEETERSVRRWLGSEIPKHKVTLLSWFGGEPLLAYRQVVSMTKYAVDAAANAGVGCVAHMTTNGSLLDPARSLELVAAGLRDFQITIDGSREAHDGFRPGRNGSGTYDRVFRNVVDLVGTDPRVNVSLRVNFNHRNLETIPGLLQAFPERVRGQLRPVFEPIFGSPCVSATANIRGEAISAALADDYALASRLGYNVVHGVSSTGHGKLVYCYAERESQVIVSFNGDVFKCSVDEFSSDRRLGYIREDGVLIKERRWGEWMSGVDLFEKACDDCLYLPTCMGGCRRERNCHGETGSACSLVPTNASFMLKQLAFADPQGRRRVEQGSPDSGDSPAVTHGREKGEPRWK